MKRFWKYLEPIHQNAHLRLCERFDTGAAFYSRRLHPPSPNVQPLRPIRIQAFFAHAGPNAIPKQLIV